MNDQEKRNSGNEDTPAGLVLAAEKWIKKFIRDLGRAETDPAAREWVKSALHPSLL